MISPLESAFPTTQDFDQEGLSKREFFAALAMQALLANPTMVNEVIDHRVIADQATLQTDELITSLNKKS